MKFVKASEARQRWFRLLDDVIAGDEVVIERKGHRIVIRKEDPSVAAAGIPDYSDISCDEADQADRWGWEWSPEGLHPIDK